MEPKPTYEFTQLPAAEISERWWLAFTPDHEPTAAAARYIERTGAPPAYLVKTPTMLLVGPLPTGAQRQAQRQAATAAPAGALAPAPTVVQLPLF